MFRIFYGLNMRKIGMTGFVRDGFGWNPFLHRDLDSADPCRIAKNIIQRNPFLVISHQSVQENLACRSANGATVPGIAKQFK